MAIERTLSIIKPDATKRNLTGKIVAKFEEAGLRVVASKRIHLTPAQAGAFYAEHKERGFYGELCAFMASEPVVVQVQRDGTLFLTYEGLDRPQPVDRAGLVAKVRGFVQADPQLSVYVAGDRDASYQTVYEVLTLLQRDAKVSRAGLMGAPADSAKAK